MLTGWVSALVPAAQAQTPPAPPLPDRPEPLASAGEPADGAHSPFEVIGTIIAPPIQIALVVVLDGAGRPLGIGRVRPGDVVEGYRLVDVEPDRATFEREGQRLVVRVGRAGGREPAGPGVPGPLPGPIFVPGSVAPVPDLPYTGPREVVAPSPPGSSSGGLTAEEAEAAGTLFEKVLKDPEFQKRLEEVRPAMRRQLEGGAGVGPAFPSTRPGGAGSSGPTPARLQ
jgi:hypothetical protein